MVSTRERLTVSPCNAAKPICSRCSSDGTPCTYTRSRRHGNRRRKADDEPAAQDLPHQAILDSTFRRPVCRAIVASAGNGRGDSGRREMLEDLSSPDPTSSGNAESGRDASAIDERLVGLYYDYFHAAHPCVLPRWALQQHCARYPAQFAPIILVMQYIGSMFDIAVDSQHHRETARQALPLHPSRTGVLSPHEIQAMLLYSIAVYWSDEAEEGIEILGKVIHGALELRMHLEPFAPTNGQGSPVLEESWRRTWWQIYVTEGNIAGSTHTYPTRLHGVSTDALLPCEEECYESGDIPPGRSLDEYDMREFLPDDDRGFSSFAHLVGLTRTLDLVLSQKAPTEQSIAAICTQLDISLSAWYSLLPQSKRCLINDNQELDMQLFKANMLINAYVVDIHRRLSDMAYFEVEAVARCAPPAPPSNLRSLKPGDTRLHTSKALLAIRRMGDLLALPPTLSPQTPFLICMIANTMVAHLSACRYLFKGSALQLERERIRSSMGALRVLGEYWPLGRRTYREMGIVAREVLGLSEKDIPQVENLTGKPGDTIASAQAQAVLSDPIPDTLLYMDLDYSDLDIFPPDSLISHALPNHFILRRLRLGPLYGPPAGFARKRAYWGLKNTRQSQRILQCDLQSLLFCMFGYVNVPICIASPESFEPKCDDFFAKL
ncbi:hypothetical protein DL764_010872 [Monosporascus ibericus]|uniref:Xylanolytic transcriptional activator regulatory domain-containing protein n=1 Tax=Monosporascus ibericus TaxID=155417 RepID=A0A4Q4SUA5_9PEZI|nr:hypothetical protein DL764_010872 [Monosporascus ibericus]